ncbi:preprotein translocase subunit SecA [Sesbania bispinosa]|nr:preprotein translocase subunit SecA [Sesbania bispinosa]
MAEDERGGCLLAADLDRRDVAQGLHAVVLTMEGLDGKARNSARGFATAKGYLTVVWLNSGGGPMAVRGGERLEGGRLGVVVIGTKR